MQIKNVAAASNAALQHDVEALQKETQEMQSKLEKSLQSFDAVQEEAQAVEGEVVDEVRLYRACILLLLLSITTFPLHLLPAASWKSHRLYALACTTTVNFSCACLPPLHIADQCSGSCMLSLLLY